MSLKYQKIPNLFFVDPSTHLPVKNEFSKPELEWLKDTPFVGTEKLDGMNMRIMWDGYRLSYGGRTDKAQFSPAMQEWIQNNILTSEREILFTIL